MKHLLLIICFLLPVSLWGQTETIVIQWDTTKHHGSFFFPNALYADGENTLPYFTRKLAWNAEGKLPSVTLEVVEKLEVGEEEAAGVAYDNVQSVPILESSLVKETGQSYLTLKILPFQISDKGELEKIGSMKLYVEEAAQLAALKADISGEWSSNSVLASGDWFKIRVEATGMHKLTYEQLQEIGIQNPSNIRIYGSGAYLLPEAFSEGYVDDLSSVPIYQHKGSDGMFGPGDHILFYARGPYFWKYSEEDQMFLTGLHPYSWSGYYFLTSDGGSIHQPEEAVLSSETATHNVSAYDNIQFYEDETYNLIKSGREWYGDNYNVNLEDNYVFPVPNLSPGEDVKINLVTAARSNISSFFQLKANTQTLGTIEMSGTNLSAYTSTYAYETSKVFFYTPSSEVMTLTLSYLRPDANSDGWLNRISVNSRRMLEQGGADLVEFRDSRSAGPGNIAEFNIADAGQDMIIWDVTDPSLPESIPYTRFGSSATFRIETDVLKEFVAFNPDGDYDIPVYEGEGLGQFPNQDLHGLGHPDMIIITPAEFKDAAQRLADHRETNDGLDVAVVLQQEVFNEFSSGTPDVSAIRNFMKMFYDRSGGTGEYCRYLLLFGDGSYDNRNETESNPNLILTYQSENSLSPTRSYVSDDFFGLLDTDESMYNGLLDIGIGRLPVSTPEEAEDMVDKIVSYSDLTHQGLWRNQLCFIGDDEDSNIHMRQADELANYVNNSYPGYNINKIYLDAYTQEKGATGFRYPEVSRAINDQMNRGALIINYTGHGGPNGLAHEQILTLNDINGWSNKKMLPLFMTATCEFSRYDEYDYKLDQEITSAGEEVLLNTAGGGIALFTTTRLVYSGPNHILNEKFYEVVFQKDENQENYRLGDIMAYSKNNTGAGVNKRNFALMGDPSMRLAYPEHRVLTDSINGIEVSASSDTLSAFEWVTVSGHLESQEGTFMSDYNGFVYPVVFDKEKKIETLSNDDDPVWSFMSRNSILYSGKATVSDGLFSFGFFVPKDINYSFGPGKISYYSNNTLVDAQGSFEGFHVGGIGSENATDLQPPEIELFMNDSFFVSGGITDRDPTLLVYVSDNYGINTTGNGIGHDLIATLDGDRINAIILNEFYQANTNSYYSGVINYPYNNLESGRHEVSVKIWDIHNNSAESSLEFIVTDSEEMLLEQLYNYPNPFIDYTLFNIEHNRPDQELRLVLTIYNLSGEMVRIIDRQLFSSGYRLEPVMWDGTSSGGESLGGGIYIYRVTLSTSEGELSSESGKLIIAR